VKIAFVTFGCRLNRAQSARERAAAEASGNEIVSPDDPQAEKIIVRCCSVTAKAARESRRAVSALRKAHPGCEVSAEGCIAGGSPDAPSLPRGTGYAPATARAYLDVQDGCPGGCTFCTVPRFRGAPRSVPLEAALSEARAFIAAGFTEITVTGCNLALYRDASSGAGLAELLERLARIESPGHRIRIGSLEPGICDGAVLSAMERNPGICRFLHIPVQSASAAVLKRMGRTYTPDALRELVARARKLFPGIALGADVIAGFPGETAAEFAETAEFLRESGFAKLHVFPYSEREGTPAAAMKPQVPPETRKARAAQLQKLGDGMREAFARGAAGTEDAVCVETPSRAGMPARGLTDGGIECEIEDCAAPRRALVRVKIAGAKGAVLSAREAVTAPRGGDSPSSQNGRACRQAF